MPNNDDNPFITRNPQIIFEPEPTKPLCCPSCKEANYTGRKIGGIIHFTCLNESCRNQWQGGLPRVPEDPRVPKPPINPKDKPRVMFDYDPLQKKEVEIRYPVDLTQEFRKGTLIGEDEDE